MRQDDSRRHVLATLDGMFRDDDGNVAKDGERLEKLGWEVVRPALPMLLGDVPGGVTAHHSKGKQYARVIVDLRPAWGESGVPEAFALPSAGGRLGDDFSNLLYVACTRARDLLCVLVDDADGTREAITGALDADLARSGSPDGDAYRYITPDELPEGFWNRGWDADGD